VSETRYFERRSEKLDKKYDAALKSHEEWRNFLLEGDGRFLDDHREFQRRLGALEDSVLVPVHIIGEDIVSVGAAPPMVSTGGSQPTLATQQAQSPETQMQGQPLALPQQSLLGRLENLLRAPVTVLFLLFLAYAFATQVINVIVAPATQREIPTPIPPIYVLYVFAAVAGMLFLPTIAGVVQSFLDRRLPEEPPTLSPLAEWIRSVFDEIRGEYEQYFYKVRLQTQSPKKLPWLAEVYDPVLWSTRESATFELPNRWLGKTRRVMDLVKAAVQQREQILDAMLVQARQALAQQRG